MMLSLRTNLRNRAFIYYLNLKVNKDPNWTNSTQAKSIRDQIINDYALLCQVMETEPYDKLILLDTFDNMYSDEYGMVRQPITTDIFHEGERPQDNKRVEDAMAIWNDFLTSGNYANYTDDWISSQEDRYLEYAITDLNADDIPELLITSSESSYSNFFTTWIFVLENSDIVLVDEIYGYGLFRYSPSGNSILVSPEVAPFSGASYFPFYKLKGRNLEYMFAIIEDEGKYFYIDDFGRKDISDNERSKYLSEAVNFEWKKLQPVRSINANLEYETAVEKILIYYNEMNSDDGAYVVFDHESIDRDNEYVIVVRYQMSDKESADLLNAGGMPVANKLFDIVTVEKLTGTFYSEYGKINLPIN